jgi:hypothetical protein
VCQPWRSRGLLTLAGLHHQIVVIAPGDPDVHVAEHDGAEGFLQRFVGRAESHASASQLVFHPEGDGGVAADAADRLDDHPVDAARPAARVGEEVLEHAVSGDRDVEAGEASRATCCVGASAGLDVVVVTDDPPAGLGHLALGVLQLAGKGERRVLFVFGRDLPVPGVAGTFTGGRGHGETSSPCPTSTLPREASRAASARPWAAANARPASPTTRRSGSPWLPWRLHTLDAFLASGVVLCSVSPLEVVGSGLQESRESGSPCALKGM